MAAKKTAKKKKVTVHPKAKRVMRESKSAAVAPIIDSIESLTDEILQQAEPYEAQRPGGGNRGFMVPAKFTESVIAFAAKYPAVLNGSALTPDQIREGLALTNANAPVQIAAKVLDEAVTTATSTIQLAVSDAANGGYKEIKNTLANNKTLSAADRKAYGGMAATLKALLAGVRKPSKAAEAKKKAVAAKTTSKQTTTTETVTESPASTPVVAK